MCLAQYASKNSLRDIEASLIAVELMLDDKSVGAKGLITFNVGDFQDVCHKNSIDILF